MNYFLIKRRKDAVGPASVVGQYATEAAARTAKTDRGDPPDPFELIITTVIP